MIFFYFHEILKMAVPVAHHDVACHVSCARENPLPVPKGWPRPGHRFPDPRGGGAARQGVHQALVVQLQPREGPRRVGHLLGVEAVQDGRDLRPAARGRPGCAGALSGSLGEATDGQCYPAGKGGNKQPRGFMSKHQRLTSEFLSRRGLARFNRL